MRASILDYCERLPLRWLRASAALAAALERHAKENPEAAARLSDGLAEHLHPSERDMLHRAVWLTRTNYQPPPGWTRPDWRAAWEAAR